MSKSIYVDMRICQMRYMSATHAYTCDVYISKLNVVFVERDVSMHVSLTMRCIC